MCGQYRALIFLLHTHTRYTRWKLLLLYITLLSIRYDSLGGLTKNTKLHANPQEFLFNSCFISICNPMGYDRPTTPDFYIHAWPEVTYFMTLFAFPCRNLVV